MSNHNKGRGKSGRGYYLALILCAVAIGISGYVYYQNTDSQQGEEPGEAVLATVPSSATQPTGPDLSGRETAPIGGTGTTDPTKPTKPSAGKLSVCAPVEGEVIWEYAMETLSYNQTTRDWRVHNGVDYAAQAGTAVKAAADGQVYTVYEDEQMGMTVVIRHEGGYVTKYASLAPETQVSPGDTVKLGQTIGSVGQTALMETALGDHVHFSVTCNGENVNPLEFLAG